MDRLKAFIKKVYERFKQFTKAIRDRIAMVLVKVYQYSTEILLLAWSGVLFFLLRMNSSIVLIFMFFIAFVVLYFLVKALLLAQAIKMFMKTP